jgi:hypothetical protein
MDQAAEIIKRMNTDFIDPIDGTIEDEPIETFYFQCERVGQADGYLRLLGDAGAYDFETRILNTALIHWGWMPKDEAEKLKEINNDLLAACKDLTSSIYNRGISCQSGIIDKCMCQPCVIKRAEAAIKKAEE